MTFQITSPAFPDSMPIPPKYTCDGDDLSPPLQWQEAPEGTQSFVLIVDDPDAPMGTWDHWILYNIPADTLSLSEDIQALPPSVEVGENSWGRKDYGGPCPPDGMHHYLFKLYALDTQLDLPSDVSKEELKEAMQRHILDETQLTGTFARS